MSPELIHAHWWLPGGLVAAGTGVPFIVTCHGSDVRLLDRSAILRRLARAVLARASAVTTVSRFLARDIHTRLPSLSTPVCALRMPIDFARFSAGRATPRAEPPRILYAGNLIESKGVSDLIEAYALLRRGGIACRLRILGEGPDEGELRALGERLGIAGEIDWSGFVSQNDMPAEYGASTVTVLPTRGDAEGLGLTLVEALAAGCAVVGTSAGGIPEVVIHERTGLLARGGDPGDLARQLERILLDPELRERLAAQGRSEVEGSFAAEGAVRGFLTLYDDVVHHPLVA
jgi:glycosyltransferase involved in cell wall biosynthesis